MIILFIIENPFFSCLKYHKYVNITKMNIENQRVRVLAVLAKLPNPFIL